MLFMQIWPFLSSPLTFMPATESIIIIIINTLSYYAAPVGGGWWWQHRSLAPRGLLSAFLRSFMVVSVVVGVPPFSSRFSPPRSSPMPLLFFPFAAAFPSSLFSSVVHCSREGAVQSAPRVRSRQLSRNHHLSSTRHRFKTKVVFFEFPVGCVQP